MARVRGGIHRRCSSEVVGNCDININPCLEEFHVLAVDDSFVDRKVIERLLKISSCKVTVVESGKRALQFLGLDEEKGSSIGSDGMKVHLIITDYSMPGMTGYELLKKIKQESSSFKEVPVVIMSSENILTRINRCLEEGAKDYLVKPVKLADVKRLKEFMQGHSHAVEEKSNTNPILQELHDLPSAASRPSTSSEMDFSPVIISYPCTSTNCVCISMCLRFRSRSSKYHTC